MKKTALNSMGEVVNTSYIVFKDCVSILSSKRFKNDKYREIVLGDLVRAPFIWLTSLSLEALASICAEAIVLG